MKLSDYDGRIPEPPYETPADVDFMAAHIEALEQQVERLEKDRDYCVVWLYANINDPGLLQHFERARTLAVEEEA